MQQHEYGSTRILTISMTAMPIQQQPLTPPPKHGFNHNTRRWLFSVGCTLTCPLNDSSSPLTSFSSSIDAAKGIGSCPGDAGTLKMSLVPEPQGQRHTKKGTSGPWDAGAAAGSSQMHDMFSGVFHGRARSLGVGTATRKGGGVMHDSISSLQTAAHL